MRRRITIALATIGAAVIGGTTAYVLSSWALGLPL